MEILNPDDGKFFLTITNSDGDNISNEDNLDLDISASSLRNVLQSEYYYRQVGSALTVTRTMYDVDGAETSTYADAASIMFNIKVEKRITSLSFAAITATVFDSGATINFYYVANGDSAPAVQSSDPLNGHFTITCTDPDTGESVVSGDMWYGWNYNNFMDVINVSMPFLADKIYIYNGVAEGVDDRWYWDNYRKFYIEFVDTVTNYDKCTI